MKFFIFEQETSVINRPCILFFIGGSFKKAPLKTPADFQHQANYFSSKGMVAICVDYRTGYDEGLSPIQAICDVKSSIRWVRENFSELGIDPNKIVVCGSSAGAYIAVSSIMFADVNDERDNLATDHVPNALVVFSSVMDGVDIMRRRYPEFLDKAIEISPLHNVKNCLPQTLWLCGTSDIDYEHNTIFVQRMVDKGNDITFIKYEGMEHGFFHYGKHENKYFHETIHEMEGFLKINKIMK